MFNAHGAVISRQFGIEEGGGRNLSIVGVNSRLLSEGQRLKKRGRRGAGWCWSIGTRVERERLKERGGGLGLMQEEYVRVGLKEREGEKRGGGGGVKAGQ